MKKFIFSSMLFGGLMMASCSDDVMEAPVQEDVRKEYAKNFVETFGPISRNVDWNASAIKTITVNGVANADVNVYASVLGTYRLAGVYTGVNSGDKLEFTTYKLVDNIIATCDGKAVAVNTTSAVADFSAVSRTFATPAEGSHFSIVDSKTFTGDEINKNINNTDQGAKNWNTSTTLEFKYLIASEDAPVVLYPLYWEGEHTHKLYIYWKDFEGEHEELIYTTKTGDKNFTVNGNVVAANVPGIDASYDVKGGNGTSSIKVANKGIQINLPRHQMFALKLEVYDDKTGELLNTWYTDADKNQNKEYQARFQSAKNKVGPYNTIHWEESALVREKKKGESAGDYNDFILIANNVDAVSSKPQAWVLAVEDLGTTDDYDFNDIVLYIEHAKNYNKAAVTVLAAGGTLEAYLQYKGNTVGQEIHAWFNETPANTYPMINTFEEGLRGNTILIDVDDDFTMASYTEEVPRKMGDFTISVNGNEGQMIAPPNKGEVPQIICLPEGWLWPRERVSMNDAYPEFTKYVQFNDERAWGDQYPVEGWMSSRVDDLVLGNTGFTY